MAIIRVTADVEVPDDNLKEASKILVRSQDKIADFAAYVLLEGQKPKAHGGLVHNHQPGRYGCESCTETANWNPIPKDG